LGTLVLESPTDNGRNRLDITHPATTAHENQRKTRVWYPDFLLVGHNHRHWRIDCTVWITWVWMIGGHSNCVGEVR